MVDIYDECILGMDFLQKHECHIVSAEGIATDPEKNATVKEWPTPTNVSEVKSFFILSKICSLLRRYSPTPKSTL